MGVPFSVVEGVIFLADKFGNIVGTKSIAGELDEGGVNPLKRVAANAVIQGGALDAGQYRTADVIFQAGLNRLATNATVTVEQIFGQDNFADTWFFITNAGVNGNTFTVAIAAGAQDSTSPDRDPPAYSKVITCTATEAGDEIKMRDKIIAELNADVLFSPHWKASSIKDNPAVHISSKYIGEFGDRNGALDFDVTTTGVATVYFESSDNHKIYRRGKKNSGVRDPRDKRLVTVGISGEVQAVPGAVGDLFIANAKNNNGTGSADMKVNGSMTPNTTNTFIIPPPTTKDAFVEEIRFYGNGNGIKFGQFLSQNSALTNGILVEIRSDELVTQLPVIYVTDDFKHKFAFGAGQGFQLHVQAGRDDFMASLKFSSTFPLRKQGTFVSGDDYVKIFIRDNLTGNLQVLEFLAIGFQKEV